MRTKQLEILIAALQSEAPNPSGYWRCAMAAQLLMEECDVCTLRLLIEEGPLCMYDDGRGRKYDELISLGLASAIATEKGKKYVVGATPLGLDVINGNPTPTNGSL